MKIVTAAEMREIDRRTIKEFGIPSEQLMLEAGTAVADFVCGLGASEQSVAIFCGAGNNGGDGRIAARILSERGWDVECNPESTHAAVVVDAILGTGARGDLTGEALEFVRRVNASKGIKVAVDIPTGIDCDSGIAGNEAVRADYTLTLGLPKPFLFQGDGVDFCGEWMVAPLQYPEELFDDICCELVSESWVRDALPKRSKLSHKGSNGRVGLWVGSAEFPGAAVLATFGAQCSGAGYVHLFAPKDVCDLALGLAPEVITHPDEFPSQVDSIAVGCGFGSIPHHRCSEVLKALEVPIVLDADALQYVDCLQVPGLLTPHPGELAKLLGISVEEIQQNRIEIARLAAKKFGHTVLLKGAHTVIAETDGNVWVNPTGNSGMATAGMGDVLAGVAATYLAQTGDPTRAGILAAYVHGFAGDLCATGGDVGFTASDVARAIPAARAEILR